MSGAAHDPMQVLLDEAEIRRVLYRYVRGIDRHDPELVRSCYHHDADDNHGNFSGTRDEFVAWAAEDTAQYAFTSHHLTNIIIEVCGDAALVETYPITANGADTAAGTGKDFMGGARYIDRFEKRDGSWLIAERHVVTDWMEKWAPHRDRLARFGPVGHMNGDDLLYEVGTRVPGSTGRLSP